MDNIEVLGYCLKSSQKMVDFIDFCIKGTKGDLSEPGVFEWLYSRPVTKAHFFTSAANDSMGVFGVTLLQPSSEPDAVPWTDQIKGFERFVSMDGELARVHAFPGTLRVTVTPNQYLDDKFANDGKRAKKIFEALEAKDGSRFSFTAKEFTAALRGSASVDRQAILSEIEAKLGEPLFEKPDRARILESLGVRT
jgi:hypothetical protein